MSLYVSSVPLCQYPGPCVTLALGYSVLLSGPPFPGVWQLSRDVRVQCAQCREGLGQESGDPITTDCAYWSHFMLPLSICGSQPGLGSICDSDSSGTGSSLYTQPS